MTVNTSQVEIIKRDICLSLGLDPGNPPVSINNNDASKALNTKPGTLNVWRSTGSQDLPFIKVGRSVRYRLDDLAVFIARRTYRHTGEM